MSPGEMVVYRLPDHVDVNGRTWAFWPWVASNLAGIWERFGSEAEAVDFANGRNRVG